MTATEELRRLLDERGVEWWNDTDPEPQVVTMARVDDRLIEYREYVNDTVGYDVWPMHNLTPAQAVDATLGRGECHMQLRDDIRGRAYQDTYECSGCGEQVLRETFMGESEPPRYCPNCGRKVVGNDKHSM